jgi:antitoxin FitA
MTMAQILVRNLSEEVHRALKLRAAAETGGSVEALARSILSEAATEEKPQGFGNQLRGMWGGVYTDELKATA